MNLNLEDAQVMEFRRRIERIDNRERQIYERIEKWEKKDYQETLKMVVEQVSGNPEVLDFVRQINDRITMLEMLIQQKF